MALIIPDGYAQVLVPLKHANLARSAACTFGVNMASWTESDQDLCDAICQAWETAWDEWLDSQVTIGPVVLRVGQSSGDPLTVIGTTTQAGANTDAQSPPNVALLVKKASATGGRRGRGRMYLPWTCQEDAVDEVGNIGGASLSAFQVSASAFYTDLGTGVTGTDPSPMVILHDSSGAGVEPGPSLVTALNVDSRIATQRRRLGR